MTTLQPTYEPALTFDFRPTLQANRLKGLLQMMADYRLPYIAAIIAGVLLLVALVLRLKSKTQLI